MHIGSLAGVAVILATTSGCASAPRLSTSTTCTGTAAGLVVQTVDRTGKQIAFAPVSVTTGNRVTRVVTETNSAGRLALALEPGAYSLVLGDNVGEWQSVRAPIRLRPGCVVTARAKLTRHEINPAW